MSDLHILTPKQRQVYDLTIAGKTPAEIAKRMKIGPTGVYGHLRKMRQLGIDPTIVAALSDDEPEPDPLANSNGRAPSAEEFLANALTEAQNAQLEVGEYIKQRRAEIEQAEAESARLSERISKLGAAAKALA
jgi:hypothetical protein